MIIGIEGQRLFRKKKHGMDIVALELIRRLSLFDKSNNYVIIVKKDDDTSCIQESENIKIVVLPKAPYPIWEQLLLPRAAIKAGCDILHCTSNTAPLFSKIPLITTVHDIIYLEKVRLLTGEGSYYQRMGNLYRLIVVPLITRRSKRVVTVSEFERNNIQQTLGINTNLSVIYNGVSDHFKKITDPAILKTSKTNHHLPDNFILFLGNTDPKKNTRNVLKAFAIYQQKYDDTLQLVIPDLDEQYLKSLLNETVKPDIRNKIVMTGYIPNHALPAVLTQSRILLYPSLRESFGIPILEGMACGVPVITSITSSMPEVAGDAAFLVDPTCPEAIADAIHKVLTENELAENLSKKGVQRADQFSWNNTAQQYISLYKEVYKEINP